MDMHRETVGKIPRSGLEEITGRTPGRIPAGISRGISKMFLEFSDTLKTPTFVCFYQEFGILFEFLSHWEILIDIGTFLLFH